ncbi:agamous-like MADS-box protein MADS1 isoform X2 [Cryptomeria japonica]|uniref:agamous-like MADS-box protein MADS1 isoform X2 n=1 Tax=Cryptomeria japonica TaxID=3369 RepID=UPI0027D9EAE6|nr:agamous-like MADS-box protein MADS1 isoform X2 [Cryptomeria japonica]
MVRGKVHMEKVQDPVNRRVTFCKRKTCLLKKGKELSTLCDAEIGLIIFSPTGKLYEFASPSMRRITKKYQKFGASMGRHIPLDEHLERLRSEVENLQKQMADLEKMNKYMNGEHLDLLNFKELKCLEMKMNSGVRKIRWRKGKFIQEYIRCRKIEGVPTFKLLRTCIESMI